MRAFAMIAALSAVGCSGSGVVAAGHETVVTTDAATDDGATSDTSAADAAIGATWWCNSDGGAAYESEARSEVLAGVFMECSEATPQDCANDNDHASSCCYFYASSAVYVCVAR